MKVLVLSLEFNAGTFSGNGVYACSQARALSQLGHEVLVVAGAPPGHTANAAASDSAIADGCCVAGLEGAPGVRVFQVELPVWGRLDAGCAWREFAAGAALPQVASVVAAFHPTAVLGVDWHSVAAYEQLTAALQAGAGAAAAAVVPSPEEAGGPALAPFVYLNYRVHHRTATADELAVIEAQEAAALRASACSLVLSRADADYIRQHFAAAVATAGAPLHVLLPALRCDMERLPPPTTLAPAAALAAGAEAAASGAGNCHGARSRHYLACCVRVSPEKEPDRFVDLIVELQRRGSLARLGSDSGSGGANGSSGGDGDGGVIPLMCGAGWDSEYGRQLRQRVEEHVPQCVIHDTFMGPAELAAVYAQTLLNVHPPTYDAYGMTIVEAASQGAPSLVQGDGHVGATDLLSCADEEVLCCDMDQPTSVLADLVERLLADRGALAAVGQRAQAKARSWTEHDNARSLVQHVQQALGAL